MHKISPIVLALLMLATSSSSFAQKRVEAGVFIDYLNISETSTNNFGLGGRFGYRVHRDVMLEAELAYDYGINFDEAYLNIANGNITAIERTSVGVTQGLFGPSSSPQAWIPSLRNSQRRFREFPPKPQPAPLQRCGQRHLRPSQLQPECRNLSSSGSRGEPGPVGLRFELGDEIYFNNGTHNNPRVTFGPILKF